MERSFTQQEYLAARSRLHQLNQRAKKGAAASDEHTTTTLENEPNEENSQIGRGGSAPSSFSSSPSISSLEADLEEADETFERSIRTAGLRRGRENALLDEARQLVNLRRAWADGIEQAHTLAKEDALRAAEVKAEKRVAEAQRSAAGRLEEANQARADCEDQVKAVNERCAALVDAERAQAVQWRAEQERRMRGVAAEQEEKARSVADARVKTVEEKFDQRVCEVRRGAEARVLSAQEQASSSATQLELATRAQEEQRALAQACAGAAATSASLQAQVRELESSLATQLKGAAKARAELRGRAAELEDLLATQREEVEVVRRARESDAKRSAASRETELAQLDARVRKALDAKQFTVDRLRSERDGERVKAAEAEALFRDLEESLTQHSPPPRNHQRHPQQQHRQGNDQEGRLHVQLQQPRACDSQPQQAHARNSSAGSFRPRSERGGSGGVDSEGRGGSATGDPGDRNEGSDAADSAGVAPPPPAVRFSDTAVESLSPRHTGHNHTATASIW
mmetsp:Transcript_34328/g.57672  ORF Transcript_34328/g.57672 Transcript_34328/m.57672 type:complete len:514 (+) Transcript_34328:45-1586(+)